MAEIKLTAAQEKAVYYGDGNLLISAAAGSGKTATLSGRIVELIVEGRASLSEMLIVTFTRASAGEMRERISKKLREAAAKYRDTDPEIAARINRAAAEIPSAEISTIHAFLYKNLKPYFGVLGIAGDAKIGEQQVVDAMKRECMKNTVDDFFENDRIDAENASTFTELADVIGQVRDTSTVDAELLWLSDSLHACGKSSADLVKYASRLDEIAASRSDFMETSLGLEVLHAVESFAEHYGKRARYFREEMPYEEKVFEKYGPNLAYISEWIDDLVLNLRAEIVKYSDLKALFARYSTPKLGTLTAKFKTELSEEFKDFRDDLKKDLGSMRENFFAADESELGMFASRTAQILRAAACVIAEFEAKLAQRKRSQSLIDYNDLEEFAIKLFLKNECEPTEEAIEIGGKYAYIFIDEYQDTNRVQDRIFAAISGRASRFIVGDIKQSIYRFRGAEPSVFAEYRQKWNGGSDGESIFMSENFRCDRAVIDFVNLVSRHTLAKSDIPYEQQDELVCAKNCTHEQVPVEVCLIRKPEADAENKYTQTVAERNPEAWYTALRIREMIGRYSPEGNAILKPGDVAVILRSPSVNGQDYVEALAMNGVPAAIRTTKPLDEYASVMLLICILRTVNNPLNDVYLAGALRSPVFGFSASDLVKLREAAGEMPLYYGLLDLAESEEVSDAEKSKCTKTVQWINRQKLISEGISVEKYLEQLIESSDLKLQKGIRGNGNELGAIQKFCGLAKQYESGGYDGRNGIAGFLEYLETALTGAETGSDTTDADAVQIISIHSSKGLEYPVVFLSECAKQRNARDEQGTMLFDQELGLGMYIPDQTGLVRCDNLIRRAVAQKIRRESIAEEMRMLYVALTRARNRLIVTAKTKDPEKELQEAEREAVYADRWSVEHTKNYIGWILQACGLCKNDKPFLLTIVDSETESETESLEIADENEMDLPDQLQNCEISARFGREYGYGFLENIPSKLTVSRLNPEILDEYEVNISELSEDETQETEPEQIEMKKPSFMLGAREDSGRERGSATHKFMQFVRFADLNEYGYETELNRLIADGYLSENESGLINIQQIERFRRSDLMQKMLRSPFVKREFRFNHRMPAADFTDSDEKKRQLDENAVKITVQGVVDCVYRDPETGKLVLVDYKTDALTQDEWKNQRKAEEKLRQRHKNQLKYYGQICSELFNEPIDGVYIYSTVLGRMIRV